MDVINLKNKRIMKNKLLMRSSLLLSLGFSVLLFSSCGNDEVTISKQEYNRLHKIKTIDFGDLVGAKIVVIDSCEYIQYDVQNYYAVTHKGNCKFCAKRNKTEK